MTIKYKKKNWSEWFLKNKITRKFFCLKSKYLNVNNQKPKVKVTKDGNIHHKGRKTNETHINRQEKDQRLPLLI